MIDAALIVLAKVPRPGRVKTRLTPPFSPSQAANLAAAALADTLEVAAYVPVTHRVLAMDGSGEEWLAPGFDLIPQRGQGLDERITHVFADVWDRFGVPALLVGMDTPQVRTAELTSAAEMLTAATASPSLALVGLADDGGFWSLGARTPARVDLRGVPMSTSRTGEATMTRLRDADLSVSMLARHQDVDDAASAAAVAALAPHTRFARAYATLGNQRRTA